MRRERSIFEREGKERGGKIRGGGAASSDVKRKKRYAKKIRKGEILKKIYH